MLAPVSGPEPVHTETLNRYIADTTALLSAHVQTSTKEAEDEIDEDDINEVNAEVGDGDESDIENIGAVKNFMKARRLFFKGDFVFYRR